MIMKGQVKQYTRKGDVKVGLKVVYIIALRQARRAGWLLQEIAEETSLAPGAVSKIVNCSGYPSTRKMRRKEEVLEQWYRVFEKLIDKSYEEYEKEKVKAWTN